MNKIKRQYIILCLCLITTSCTDHRDLYVASYPQLMIENDWEPSRISTNNGATAMIYDKPESPTLLIPNSVRNTLRLDHGFYDILVFNGLMYSPAQSHLDNIYYRGTDSFETFEAVATPMHPSAVFRQSGDITIEFPDILSTRSTADKEIEGRKKFELKYRDGTNGFPTSFEYVEDTVFFSPCRVTHTCQVIARVRNAKSARIVQAKLNGFAGSVFLANRLPSHSSVTHQFTLNSLKFDQADPLVGTISSPVFNTFGPPLDLPGRTYELELDILLTNSQEYPPMRFDVTNQVENAIAYLKAERLKDRSIMETFYIIIEFELPPVISDNLDVGIDDWGNDIIVTIPINK